MQVGAEYASSISEQEKQLEALKTMQDVLQTTPELSLDGVSVQVGTRARTHAAHARTQFTAHARAHTQHTQHTHAPLTRSLPPSLPRAQLYPPALSPQESTAFVDENGMFSMRTQYMRAYVGDDGCVHVVAEKETMSKQLRALDLSHARTLTYVPYRHDGLGARLGVGCPQTRVGG
jgi:hypothetical protein